MGAGARLNGEAADGKPVDAHRHGALPHRGQELEEPSAGHLDRSHGRQVLGRELHVDEGSAGVAPPGGQIDKGHLGRVGATVEHRLAREAAADPHPVDAADQYGTVPHLEAVGPAQVVETAVRIHHPTRDPRALPPGSHGTCGDDTREVGVDRRLPSRRAEALAQRAAHVGNGVGDQGARVGREPGELHMSVGPGEDPPAVGVHQRLRSEVGTEADEVGVTTRRVGEHPGRRCDRPGRWSEAKISIVRDDHAA